MTKECPMTNDQTALTPDTAAILVELWALGLGHSLVIGHWSLGVRRRHWSLILRQCPGGRGPGRNYSSSRITATRAETARESSTSARKRHSWRGSKTAR